MHSYTVQSPNTCGLVILPTRIAYVGVVGAITYAPDDSTFEEFLTQDAAAARAVEIDPSFDLNLIYGPLTLEPTNVSPYEESLFVGQSVTLNCEYSCGDLPVSYEWKNPGGLVIPGATQSHLTLNRLTERMDGVYTCVASVSNAKGQTGSAGGSFKVTVYPAIEPGAVAE